MLAIQQRVLKTEQVEEFYLDLFVTTRVRDAVDFVEETKQPVNKVVDIVGDTGFFANALAQKTGPDAQIVEIDPSLAEACVEHGRPAESRESLNSVQCGGEDIVSSNLTLHHPVAAFHTETEVLQKRANAVWQRKAMAMFVNKYLYESCIGNALGWLIYRFISSQPLSALGQEVVKFVLSLRANTCSIGVRSRADQELTDLFYGLGFTVAAYRIGPEENVSLARRILIIKSCRRDSYLLVAK